jgi:hypothetical protein
VATLAQDLVTLLRQRQSVHVDDVVEHAREHFDHFAKLVPVEVGALAERSGDELRQVDRAE